jgi:putative FmdB family regulatory protein
MPREKAPAGGPNMPVYDYKCSKCGKQFTVTLTISEHDANKARCPKCDSKQVVQQITGFSVKTSKKS